MIEQPEKVYAMHSDIRHRDFYYNYYISFSYCFRD